ncbi:hypothetical protein RRG08_024843 [Elysia crispata]|uniref:Uncharacterized protein n=1 Tax=Elysia crispata TaxID=231223 RepID=A0AAE1CZS1_9GAST|nr:hypothetical protein RRG08_024843 [Elysia crispata]
MMEGGRGEREEMMEGERREGGDDGRGEREEMMEGEERERRGDDGGDDGRREREGGDDGRVQRSMCSARPSNTDKSLVTGTSRDQTLNHIWVLSPGLVSDQSRTSRLGPPLGPGGLHAPGWRCWELSLLHARSSVLEGVEYWRNLDLSLQVFLCETYSLGGRAWPVAAPITLTHVCTLSSHPVPGTGDFLHDSSHMLVHSQASRMAGRLLTGTWRETESSLGIYNTRSPDKAWHQGWLVGGLLACLIQATHRHLERNRIYNTRSPDKARHLAAMDSNSERRD